ncbi:MAG: hypothetical protein GC189_13040 [Alphaproteobacteria bacterium]|nr:hypothetical protein [Alphaproteobacteria bacterium]
MSVHKWLVGFALAVIMVGALFINSLLFSARSFQFSLAQHVAGSNGTLSLSQLSDIESQIDEILQQTADQRGELLEIEQGLARLDGQAEAREAEITAVMGSLASNIATIEERLGIPSSESPAALDSVQLEQRARSLAGRPGLPAAESQTISMIREQADRLGALGEEEIAQERERRDLIQRQRLVGGTVQESTRRINGLKQTLVSDVNEYDRIHSEAQALVAASPLRIGAAMVQAHPAFLSTLLVLLMGALGAILYLFPAYMSRATPVTFAEIIVRLIFGMVTALAFYVVANATLAGLSFVPGQNTAASNAAMLNPFTVGLVGVVAGIMADDIAKWIQRRGTEILGGAPGTPPPAQAQGQANTGVARQGEPPAASRVNDPGFTGVNPHGGHTP